MSVEYKYHRISLYSILTYGHTDKKKKIVNIEKCLCVSICRCVSSCLCVGEMRGGRVNIGIIRGNEVPLGKI